MKQILALFDFDGTLVPGDSIVAYLKLALQKGYVDSITLAGDAFVALLGYAKLVSFEKGKTHALKFLRKLTPEQRAAFDAQFVRETLARAHPAGLARIAWHKAQGHVVALCSASTRQYMTQIGSALGADCVIASTQDENGAVLENCSGETKARRIRETFPNADYAASYAYGDSASDLAMLRLVGHPYRAGEDKTLVKAGIPPFDFTCPDSQDK